MKITNTGSTPNGTNCLDIFDKRDFPDINIERKVTISTVYE
jgi:hypothetical protein